MPERPPLERGSRPSPKEWDSTSEGFRAASSIASPWPHLDSLPVATPGHRGSSPRAAAPLPAPEGPRVRSPSSPIATCGRAADRQGDPMHRMRCFLAKAGLTALLGLALGAPASAELI